MKPALALVVVFISKTIRWYDAGHGLNQQAVFDRLDSLHGQIGLDAR